MIVITTKSSTNVNAARYGGWWTVDGGFEDMRDLPPARAALG